jgi:hypothetical protein
MRSFLFKAAFAIALLPLVLCSSAKAQVQDSEGCTNATLKGDYAFTVSGQFFLPGGIAVQREGIAMTHFDGAGNLSQVDMVLSNPNAPPPPGVSPTDPDTGFHNGEKGTYKVNQDCTGTFTINFPELTNPATGKMTSGAIIVASFVLSDHGRAIHTVVTSLTPPGAPGPVPALIRSDGYKLGRAAEN